MSSDRERISTDAKQQYRSVVYQQGRVTLAGDANEAQDIANEALRADADDIVGPAGTPDNGYALSSPGKFGPNDFTIGKGTMYLGGERMELPQDITYFGQKDGEWLDFPDHTPLSPNEQAWLLVREQELGAVEDPNLLEVALGGPDTAERTRFVQRVVRQAVKSIDCPSASNEVLAGWKNAGYDFDWKLMRLLPFARLQVGFADTKPQPDPCQPAAQGGYLGANNQCVRVMVTAYDAATKSAKIVWAFDNAYHLFKVVVQNDKQTLKLGAPPVDSFHWPRAGQTVEVLRSAVRLADGNTMAQNLGLIGTLVADYNADQRTVQLNAALNDPPFTPNTVDPPVFLRLWEQELDAQVGQPVTLGDTGLQITLTAQGNNAIATGVFWVFAVRPTTPQEVYPHRYLVAPQPCEGPRLWGCPLAILKQANEVATVTADCRNPFDNLVELSKHKNGCCELTVGKNGTYPDLAAALADISAKKMTSVGLCLLADPVPHKVKGLIKVQKQPQLRIEITGAGPMTMLEIEGGGFDILGIRAFALNKLQVRLMDEQSRFMISHCESLEVFRTRIDRVFALQTVPLVQSVSNRNTRIEHSTFDAGYAMFTEFIAILGTVAPQAMPLFAVELLQDQFAETVNRLTLVAKLSETDMTSLLKQTRETIIKQGFDNSPYAKSMSEWLRIVGQVRGASAEALQSMAKELQAVLQQLLQIQTTRPGTGVVLDHTGDNWLQSSKFQCSVSFSGVPNQRIGNFSDITKWFKEQLVMTANGQVAHLTKCTFDLLTYGDSLVTLLTEKHKAGDPFYAPTSLVVDGCMFRVSPCFFFGFEVFMTNNQFTFNRNIGAWVLSHRFCPVSNTGAEGPIQYFAQNNMEPFRPINLISLVAS